MKKIISIIIVSFFVITLSTCSGCSSGDGFVDDVDMANPDSLADFIEWGISSYPAEQYVLVLWDHGSGWRGQSPEALSRNSQRRGLNNPSDGDGVREWTYLVYLAGTNSLSDYAAMDLTEMETVGSNDDVAIVVQFENNNYRTSRYYIGQDEDSSVVIDLCEEDPDVCFWDRGNSDAPTASKGAIQDTGQDTYMTIEQIASGLQAAETATGERIDIVRFDACLMGMYEVAYELKDLAGYLVFSEELVPGYGDPYDTILDDLQQNPNMTPAELAALIVDDYDTLYADGSFGGTTNSAVDLSQMDAVDTAVLALASAIQTAGSTGLTDARNARNSSLEFDSTDYHDLYDVADYLAVNSSTPGIVTAATDLRNAVDTAVIANATNDASMADAYGLSIFLPAINEVCATSITNYNEDMACNDRDSSIYTWGDLVNDLVPSPGLSDNPDDYECQDLFY